MVQVRLVEELAAEATVEARIQIAAKALVEATSEAIPTVTPIPSSLKPEATASITPIPLSSTPAHVGKISAHISQSLGNSGSETPTMGALDKNGDPESPVGHPSAPIPDRPMYPRLDSQLNKLVAQIGSTGTLDITRSAPVFLGDRIAVTVRLSHNLSSTVDSLESTGAIVANIGTDYIEVYTPVTVLVALSERDGVLRVEMITIPEPAITNQ